MKKFLLAVLLVIVYSFPLLALNLPTNVKNVNDIVPNGWKIITEKKGDLNSDNLDDIALVIEDTDPKNLKKNEVLGPDILNLNKRIILVLFKKEDGYHLVAKNDKGFIESAGNIESPALMDPFSGVEIENNTLKISFNYFQSAGTYEVSSLDYTFKFEKDHFELIELDSTSYLRNTGEGQKLSVNLSTKKAKKIEGNFLDESKKDHSEKQFNAEVSTKYILDEMEADTINSLFLENNF